MTGLSEEARREVYEIILEQLQYDRDRNHQAWLNFIKRTPCKECGTILTAEDVLNSTYGAFYTLCKRCASKISV